MIDANNKVKTLRQKAPKLLEIFILESRIVGSIHLEKKPAFPAYCLSLNLDLEVWRAVFPSWDRRGGRAIKNVRKARTGWSVQNDHPVCASKVASQHFL